MWLQNRALESDPDPSHLMKRPPYSCRTSQPETSSAKPLCPPSARLARQVQILQVCDFSHEKRRRLRHLPFRRHRPGHHAPPEMAGRRPSRSGSQFQSFLGASPSIEWRRIARPRSRSQVSQECQACRRCLRASLARAHRPIGHSARSGSLAPLREPAAPGSSPTR